MVVSLKYTPKPRPLRQEHYRWMREGTPNFDDNVFRHIKELEFIARKEVKWVLPSTPIIRALEEMYRSYRSLVVLNTSGLFTGLLTTMKIVNYLGGGDLFQIVEKRHRYNLFNALSKEPVESIMEKNPVTVYVDEGIKETLGRMVIYGAGIIPVLERDGRVIGVITEHDLVKYLSGLASIGVKIREVMSSPVITVNEDASLKEAMETMVRYGFRRTPVVSSDGAVVGLITAVDVVRGFGSHKLIERAVGGDIREVLSIPVADLMVRDVAVVREEDDLVEAVNTMLSRNISSVLVVDEEGVLRGIVTERDVLYAILAPK